MRLSAGCAEQRRPTMTRLSAARRQVSVATFLGTSCLHPPVADLLMHSPRAMLGSGHNLCQRLQQPAGVCLFGARTRRHMLAVQPSSELYGATASAACAAQDLHQLLLTPTSPRAKCCSHCTLDSQHAEESLRAPRADGSAAHGRPGMALVVQVTQLERRLRDERLAADVKATQLEATIRRLEAQINAEKQRRQSEQLRATVEGMPCKPLVVAGQAQVTIHPDGLLFSGWLACTATRRIPRLRFSRVTVCICTPLVLGLNINLRHTQAQLSRCTRPQTRRRGTSGSAHRTTCSSGRSRATCRAPRIRSPLTTRSGRPA